MKVELQDYYGRYITIHNKTGSGNVIFEIKTTANLNDVVRTTKENCEVTEDVSLNINQLRMIHAALEQAIEEHDQK